MKSIFVLFFLLIVLASSAFIIVYSYWKDLVEGNPVIFAIGLIGMIMTGVGGMMYSIFTRPVTEPEKSK
ncbi:MAG TPA: hypothetical protein VIN08_03745 [Ohtaekwangia sp.]|uniref:hypothetical protein n=1 Tax=Ohtaekwangia sp. TaxID=2066019 RepID=UPI002F9416F4